MIQDKQINFSEAQAVTSTAVSTNVYDLGAGPTTRDLGPASGNLWLHIITNTTCTDSGSDATVDFTLESSAAAALTSSTVHVDTGALAFATYATAGTVVLRMRLPSGSYKRYIGIRYTVASGPLTAGKFDAFITAEEQSNTAYPTSIVIN